MARPGLLAAEEDAGPRGLRHGEHRRRLHLLRRRVQTEATDDDGVPGGGGHHVGHVLPLREGVRRPVLVPLHDLPLPCTGGSQDGTYKLAWLWKILAEFFVCTAFPPFLSSSTGMSTPYLLGQFTNLMRHSNPPLVIDSPPPHPC
jgi:hypothetical protein